GPYYVRRVKAVMDGTWKSQSIWDGLKQNILIMAPYTNMPDDVKKLAEETQKKIEGGFNPFTGPVYKQDGSLWLKKGEVAEDKVLLGMNFYVKGIDDKLPQ
ncbi:MAG: BMP family ABC transporter substrate-binding protein, partial [Pararhizobium sp.]